MAYERITSRERNQIYRFRQEGKSIREIGRCLGRAASTISREVRRNSGGRGYRPAQAQRLAEQRAGRGGARKLTEEVKRYIAEKVRMGWTPEAACGEAKLAGLPHVSAETARKWICEDARAGGDLWRYLPRAGRKRRKRCPCGRAGGGRGKIPGRVDISERPARVETRRSAGDWEGDLINGRNGTGHLVTLVERKTRFTLVGWVPTKESGVVMPKVAEMLRGMPGKLLRTVTFDNGKEFSWHGLLTEATGVAVYFARPYHSWERGSNENRNGIIRRLYPKGSGFDGIGGEELGAMDRLLNDRPMKLHGWRTPREMLAREMGG